MQNLASDAMAFLNCPDCNQQVAEDNLAGHRQRVHPRGIDRVGQNKKYVFMAVAVLGVLTVAYLLATAAPPAAKGDMQARWVGREAPDFTLSATDGTTFKLSDYKGKSNVLLFFNEGLMCQGCVQQMNELVKDDARFQALNVSQAIITTNSLSSLQQWALQAGAGATSVKVLSDSGFDVDRTYETLGRDVSMMPGSSAGHTYILVDKTGKVLWRADYGPGIMHVSQDEIYGKVRTELLGG